MNWKEKKVNFKPWQGDDYLSGISDHRLLILGESHHHNCAKDELCIRCSNEPAKERYHRGLTRLVVKGWLGGNRKSRLSCHVPSLFKMEPDKFWPKVVFYNYVQDFAGDAGRIRPSKEMWADEDSANAFQAVLDCFEPDRILVLGKKLWTSLPSDRSVLGGRSPSPEPRLPVSNNIGSYNKVDECCYWYVSRSGAPALAMPIMHPSAPRFELAAWRRPVSNWLNFGIA